MKIPEANAAVDKGREKLEKFGLATDQSQN